MKSVYEHFQWISAIPRCSFQTQKMKESIINKAKKLGFEVQIDESGNILCSKGEPKICLQSHYDMVCIGDTENLQIIEDGNMIRAKNSTLGADNGMGMAMMLYCMERYENIECLFTNDEEVGLVGASLLHLHIQSEYLLNLDGEEEEEIYIGCAGGEDIIAQMQIEKRALKKDEKVFELSIENMPGGHSGVDIDKNIPSALKVLAAELANSKARLIHIEGGQFRNAIAKSAKAIVACKKNPEISDDRIHVEALPPLEDHMVIKNSRNIIRALHAFGQGVRGYDKNFNIPSHSINLGTIRQDENILKVECSARAMEANVLHELAMETCSLFELAGFEVRKSDGHEPWVPDTGNFAKVVKDAMDKRYENAHFKAIHAGLECGILIKRQHKKIEAVSIGPTIRYPHSLREECDMDSVQRISAVVEDIIRSV